MSVLENPAALERGRGWKRSELEDLTLVVEGPRIDVLALDEALRKLEAKHPRMAELVQLRCSDRWLCARFYLPRTAIRRRTRVANTRTLE